MIFRQKKLKKKEKINRKFQCNIFFWWILFHNPNTPHISSQTICVIQNAKCHPELASGSHHSSTKPLIPGFPIRSSSSSSQAPPAVDRRPSNRFHSTKSFTRIKTQRKTASNIKTASKSFCPKQKINFLLVF